MAAPGAAEPLNVLAQSAPNRPAVVEGDDVLSFRELNDEASHLAAGLRQVGAAPGDVVAWSGSNGWRALAFLHACRKSGVIAVPIPNGLTVSETAYLLGDSGAVIAVVDRDQLEKFDEAAKSAPDLMMVVSTSIAARGHPAWEELASAGRAVELPLPPGPAFGSIMIYTAGTTGAPKGAVRSTAPSVTLGAMLAALNFGRDEVHLVTGPLHHSGPLVFALLTHLLGGTVIVPHQFEPARWLDLVRSHLVTSTFVAPIHLRRILEARSATVRPPAIPSMRSLIANAAPVPASLKREVIKRLGEGFLYEVYGSTELGVTTVLPPEDQLRKPGSCGRPYAGVEVKVVDDQGHELPPFGRGELFIRSPLAFDHYHGTALSLAQLEDGSSRRWQSVGDIAYTDDDGYLYICDRKSDMVIRGGANIYPAEIEAVLKQHPCIRDAAVFGVPDAQMGEQLHAVVEPVPGKPLDQMTLESFLAVTLARYKVPRSWEFRDHLPRAETGKLKKRLLRDEYLQRGNKTNTFVENT